MRTRIWWYGLLILSGIVGCSRLSYIPIDRVEKTNSVVADLKSGKTLHGTVVKCDPVQMTLLDRNGMTMTVPKSDIRSVRRKPPVIDDFGKGISEEEIDARRSHKNAWVYGIGGGALSFGFSFFTASLFGHSSESGGTVLALGTASGTVIGSLLFIHAGQTKDRREAIAAIRTERRNVDLRKGETDSTRAEMLRRIEEERKKQDEIEKQRERLLRELESTRKQ